LTQPQRKIDWHPLLAGITSVHFGTLGKRMHTQFFAVMPTVFLCEEFFCDFCKFSRMIIAFTVLPLR